MSDNLTVRSTTICLLAAPAAWLFSALANPGERSDSAAQLSLITEHPTRWTLSAVLLVLGTVALVAGLVVLAPIARRRTPRLGLVATALVGYGLVVSIGDCFDQLVMGVLARDDNRAAAVAIADRLGSDGASGVFYATGGLAFTVGSILLGIALARSGVVPWWSGALVGASLVANIVGWSVASQPLVAATCVPLLAGIAVVVRGPGAEFALAAADPQTSSA